VANRRRLGWRERRRRDGAGVVNDGQGEPVCIIRASIGNPFGRRRPC